jgi:putative tricarboxylic transport membrane protein
MVTAITAGVFSLAGGWLSSLISFKLQWAVLALCCTVIVLSGQNKIISLLCLLLGITLATKTHPDLPSWAITAQMASMDVTVFLVTLAGVIVPSILTAGQYDSRPINKLKIDNRTLTKETAKDTAIGSVLGSIIGFMPGPAATLSSILAFRLPKQTVDRGIVRAESANNAAIITETIPFFGLGIPINTTAVMVFSIIGLKLIAWPSGLYSAWNGLPVYFWVFASAALASVIFFWASTRFLKHYVTMLNTMGQRLHWIWAGLILLMIGLDIWLNSVGWSYVIWLPLMVLLGNLLWYYKVSGVSLIFGFVLGDKLVWASMQFVEYYL